jgi:hypothetical protein
MYCAWRLDALRPLNYTEAVSEHKESLFRQALDHYRARRLAEASGLYHEILQATPNHTDVLYFAGSTRASDRPARSSRRTDLPGSGCTGDPAGEFPG